MICHAIKKREVLVSYFGDLSAGLAPVFPAVLLKVSELNMIRIDELYWKTPQGYHIFIYRSGGNHCPYSSSVLSNKRCFRDSFVHAISFQSLWLFFYSLDLIIFRSQFFGVSFSINLLGVLCKGLIIMQVVYKCLHAYL